MVFHHPLGQEAGEGPPGPEELAPRNEKPRGVISGEIRVSLWDSAELKKQLPKDVI